MGMTLPDSGGQTFYVNVHKMMLKKSDKTSDTTKKRMVGN